MLKYTETNYGGKTTISFDYYDKATGGGGNVTFYNQVGNCKVGIIEFCAGIYQTNGDQTHWKERLNLILSRLHIAVYLNTNNAIFAKWLQENYELYTYSEVPIGYSMGYQYHIVIRNMHSNSGNTSQRRPLTPKKQEPVVTQPGTVPSIEAVEAFLKSKRRKTDIAAGLIALMKGTPNT